MVKTIIIGKSVENQDILAHLFNGEPSNSQRSVLIIAGVHGNEIEGVWLAEAICNNLQTNTTSQDISVIPILNPDGVKANTRHNHNGVDLNRNMATKDWVSTPLQPKYKPGKVKNSEPETQALINFVEDTNPKLIISLHSYKTPMLNINGDCKAIAEKIASEAKLDVKESIGYDTPGCLGTYYGLERNIPVITYELFRGDTKNNVIEHNLSAIINAICK